MRHDHDLDGSLDTHDRMRSADSFYWTERAGDLGDICPAALREQIKIWKAKLSLFLGRTARDGEQEHNLAGDTAPESRSVFLGE